MGKQTNFYFRSYIKSLNSNVTNFYIKTVIREIHVLPKVS